MGLEEKISQDLVAAMKAKAELTLSTLRMTKAAITNYRIEKKKEKLDDQDVITILQKQVKQRRESIENFEKAGRQDLADKEKKEMDVLNVYLPQQLNDDEIKALVQKAIGDSQSKSKDDVGKVMKVLMPMVKGKADGRKVNEIVAGLLGS
ncbi:MAG: GatB/YqeY domain-containing protein [Candidatus Omnitrophica bacterium]|nr:GatB/YqeY domain-containing protein [Candidatus Omnitrophota bacterium]MDD5670911.1 GatB/YqeY domain-containing protein [Candidatus Omnitrophota bacterium]